MEDGEQNLDWHLTGFSQLYYTSEMVQMGNPHHHPYWDGKLEVAPVRLGKPFPTSPILTTDFGNMTAQWQVRLTSCDGEHEVYFERWSFYLDLLNAEFKSGLSESPTKKRRTIDADISVAARLVFLTPAGNESYYATEEMVAKYGPNHFQNTEELGWPEHVREAEDSYSGEGPDYSANTIHENLKKYVNPLDDTLHVRLIIRLVQSKPALPDQRVIDNLTSDLINDMTNLWESKQGADAIVRYGSGPESFSFIAHRLVLSIRNPVFKVMFDTAMMEGESKLITIEGGHFDKEILKRLLEFLYTSKIELGTLNWDQTIRLFRAADMYLVENLKDYCFQHLITQLNEDTCGDLAVAAYHQCVEPWQKKLISDYIDKNFAVLKGKEKFQELLLKYPKAFWR